MQVSRRGRYFLRAIAADAHADDERFSAAQADIASRDLSRFRFLKMRHFILGQRRRRQRHDDARQQRAFTADGFYRHT